MSFDIDIEVEDLDGNKHIVEVVCGHTYNLTPMWALALPWLSVSRDLDGKVCRDINESLVYGLYDMNKNPEKYRALNPENGWGDFEGFYEIFARFTALSLEHPSGVVRWYG